MGLFSRTPSTPPFAWNAVTSIEQLLESWNSSDVLFIFKHSTRCSISVLAKNKFEREWETPSYPHQLLYLDLLNHRDISGWIEANTHVEHQSPQLIVVHLKNTIYHNSHNAISAKESIEAITL